MESSVYRCDELIQELQGELAQVKKSPFTTFRSSVKLTRHRLSYPFRRSTLQKLDEDIDAVLESLSLTLSVLQLRDEAAIQDDLSQVKVPLKLVRASQRPPCLAESPRCNDRTQRGVRQAPTKHRRMARKESNVLRLADRK